MNKYYSMLFALIWVHPNPLNAQAAVEYTLEFKASANGLSATAERSFKIITNQTYQLTNSLQASIGGQIISNIEQVSVLTANTKGFTPISYSNTQTGVIAKKQVINYDRDNMIAISSEDDESWAISLTAETYDELSHQLALRQSFIENSPKLKFEVIDDNEIEIYHYQVLGKEKISTPLGNFNSTKLGRIREKDENTKTIFWLANDWEFLLIRMEQTNSGLTTVLELSHGMVSGQELEPL